MSRSRGMKPGFFEDEVLAEVEPLGRLLLPGLKSIADREGRLEERPKWIKAKCLPYDEVDLESLLSQLAIRGFITRYRIGDRRLIQIARWHEDQNPHCKEPPSTIPAPDKHQTGTVLEQEEPKSSTEAARRTPDSGLLTPHSRNPVLVSDTGSEKPRTPASPAAVHPSLPVAAPMASSTRSNEATRRSLGSMGDVDAPEIVRCIFEKLRSKDRPGLNDFDQAVIDAWRDRRPLPDPKTGPVGLGVPGSVELHTGGGR
jgi:hypothetical protein